MKDGLVEVEPGWQRITFINILERVAGVVGAKFNVAVSLPSGTRGPKTNNLVVLLKR